MDFGNFSGLSDRARKDLYRKDLRRCDCGLEINLVLIDYIAIDWSLFVESMNGTPPLCDVLSLKNGGNDILSVVFIVQNVITFRVLEKIS